MKLAAIYNVWIDSVELLRGSLLCVKDHVDLVIIVYQTTSNFGEPGDPLPDIINAVSILPLEKVLLVEYQPSQSITGSPHEKAKRNAGIHKAIYGNCTHFLHMDCDEYYADFGTAKQQFIDTGAFGSVCKMWTYFKKPTLRFENPDNYYVPFIHELRPDTFAGHDKYPYYVDPTRRINQSKVILIDSLMHHFSWVRKNINIKTRNSSAKRNIENSLLLQDYNRPDLGPGIFIKDFNQKLVEVENIFNIDV